MKKLLFITLFFCALASNAQQIRFEYDVAGNQIQRKWCTSCGLRNAKVVYKELSTLKDSDLQKFFPEDVISYYPNPVKEELYLKWELINDNKVSSISVYGLNGQLLKTYNDSLLQNSYTLVFQDYPVGVYVVNLNYANGDQKSIKIVKD